MVTATATVMSPHAPSVHYPARSRGTMATNRMGHTATQLFAAFALGLFALSFFAMPLSLPSVELCRCCEANVSEMFGATYATTTTAVAAHLAY